MLLKVRANENATGGVKTICLGVIKDGGDSILGRPVDLRTAQISPLRNGAAR